MIKPLIHQALNALEAEIEAVREKPSNETITHAKRLPNKVQSKVAYEIDHLIFGLKFVEEALLYWGDETLTLTPLEFKENSMIIGVEKDLGPNPEPFDIEWQNDFVLQRMVERLTDIDEADVSDTLLPYLFEPEKATPSDLETEVYEDETRNEAQLQAIQKALNTPVSFVWGPPGTGKTSTVGFIAANYLLQGKRVLFVSNTNRAVDIGVLSILDALKQLQAVESVQGITRLGDLAIEEPRLQQVHFEVQVQELSLRKQQRAAEYASLLSKLEQLSEQAEQLIRDGHAVPDALETQLIFLQDRVQALGGIQTVREKAASVGNVNELFELKRRQCVATTLAKVCTSDLLREDYFDAVIVDEASMASLPYMMIMASKAVEHFVAVGDPMQLPPIATTNDFKAKEFLEHDIFSFLSKAQTTEHLFKWHDNYPEFTSFFNEQYRMQHDLAHLISEVFYEGRLKTAALKKKQSSLSYTIVNTAQDCPEILKGKGMGFRPINLVHIQKVVDLMKHLLFEKMVRPQHIGLIVPFRSVVFEYRKAFHKQGLSQVEVGTIHTFQGREKQIILFDTVMSGEASGRSVRHYSVRPFDERKSGLHVPRLLNVAFSRSKEHLYIIADMNHIQKVYPIRFLGKLLARMAGIS